MQHAGSILEDPIEIRIFDPASAGADEWSAYHRLRRQRETEDQPERPPRDDAEFEREARTVFPTFDQRRYIAHWRGEPVANLVLTWRRENTPDYADFARFLSVGGGVIEPFRRRGVATALLHPLSVEMNARGKHTATIIGSQPDTHAFMAKLGATETIRDIESRLSTRDCRASELQSWRQAIPGNLQWEVHAPRVPVQRLAELIKPLSALMQDAPRGAYQGPLPRYELEASLARYAVMDQSGGEHLLVLLTHDGEVAAMSDASWTPAAATEIQQTFTAVHPRWRGAGLAHAVKARLVQLAIERLPQATTMITYNAVSNQRMLAVNRKLGYRVQRERVIYQLDRAQLGAYLQGRPPA
jgi:GNAT superfamily N-acetyltransferase